jgi:hypothetical protein
MAQQIISRNSYRSARHQTSARRSDKPRSGSINLNHHLEQHPEYLVPWFI